MSLKVHPSETSSFVMAKPDRITAHYAIIMSALIPGVTQIKNIAYSDDVKATLEAVKQIGAGYMITEEALLISGISPDRQFSNEIIEIDCGQSEETLKFMLPVATYFFKEVDFIIDGNLMNVSTEVYEKIYRDRGLSFNRNGNIINVSGRLEGGVFEVPENADWKSVCALMLFLPIGKFSAQIVSEVKFGGISNVYHLRDCQRILGVRTSVVGDNAIEISGDQRYRSVNITLEADYPHAACFMVLGALRGGLEVIGMWKEKTTTPSSVIIEILKRADVRISRTQYGYKIFKSETSRFAADMRDYPQLVPALCILAVFTPGYATIKCRWRDSNTLKNLVHELRKADVKIGFNEDGIVIEGSSVQRSASFSCHGDPELAMYLGIYAACCKGVSEVDGEFDNPLYPDFWHDMRCVGVRIDEI